MSDQHHKLVSNIPKEEYYILTEIAREKNCSITALLRGMIQIVYTDPDIKTRTEPVRSKLGRPIKTTEDVMEVNNA